MKTFKNILAIVVGILAGGIAVSVMEVWLIHHLFDMPSTQFPNEPESISAYMATIPLGAKWMVVLSQFVGSLIAVVVAGLLTKWNWSLARWSGLIMLVFTLANLISIPHPSWMTLSMILAAVIGLAVSLPFFKGSKALS